MLDQIPDIEPPDGESVDLDDPRLPEELPAVPADARTVQGPEGAVDPADSRAILELLTTVERQPSEDLDRYHVRVGLTAGDDAGAIVLREVDSELDLLTAEPDRERLDSSDPDGPLDMVLASTHGARTIASALNRMGQVEWVVVTDVTDAGLDEVLEAVADEPATPGPDQARTDEQFEQLREEVGEAGFDDVEAALEDVTLETTEDDEEDVDVGDVDLDELVAGDAGETPREAGSTVEALLAELRSGQVADGAIAELRSALGAAPAGADAGGEGDLRTTVETLSDAVTAATDDRRELERRIAGVEDQVAAVKGEVESGAAADGDVAERLAALESTVEELREEVERGRTWRQTVRQAMAGDSEE